MDSLERLLKEYQLKNAEDHSRRHFLHNCTLGLGGIALCSLVHGCDRGVAQAPWYTPNRALNPLSVLPAPFAPKVKSVIYLHMVGAPSQLEMFDYKPELKKLHNQLCPDSLLEGKKFAFIRGRPTM